MEKDIKNVSAERIAIGVLLNHPNWLVELAGQLKVEYLYMKGHKLILYILSTLMQEGVKEIDCMAVMARAEKIDSAYQVIEENGGIEYLLSLLELAEQYNLDDLKMYVDDIKTASFKREFLRQQEATIEKVRSRPELSVAAIDALVQENRVTIMQKYSVRRKLVRVGDVLDEDWNEIEAQRTESGIYGIPTKYDLLNKFFTYENGELYIGGARAKWGKSNFSINEVHHKAIVIGIPCAVLDTEMNRKTFILRMVALDSGVSIPEIKSGAYKRDVDKLMAVEASKDRIKKAPIFHKYDTAWNMENVGSEARVLKLQHDIGFLVYDYIKVKEVKSGVKEHSELGNWTIFLKDLAGELDIPILTFGQMSPYEKRLADSDKLNRYASTIFYMYDKSKEAIQRDMGVHEGGNAMFWVDYNRNGASMDDEEKGVNIVYDRERSRMEQAEYQCLDDEYA